MTALSVPLASICLILDDVNSQMLTDIGGVLPVNFTGDSGTILKDTIDKCFRNPDKSANPLLLDIIFTRNKTSDEKITLRTTIVNGTKNSINKQFDGIAKAQEGDSMKLNTDPEIVKLKNTLRDAKMDAMMVPEESYDWANSPYKDMSFDARATDGVSVFWASPASCADFLVPADMGRLSGETMKGIETFVTSLQFLGTLKADASCPGAACPCARQVTCDDASSTQKGKACIAANKFMKLKQDIRKGQIFKCRKFEKADGTLCDVKDMVENPVGSGSFTGDCLLADGTLKQKEYDCDLAEFTTLVADFNQRLNLVFERLDGAADVTMAKINVGMRGLVDTNILNAIDLVADGLTCGFLGKAYQSFIDGTCYAGVWGFTQVSKSYVAAGVLTLILVMKMYIVWRVSIDNYNSNSAAKVAPMTDTTAS